LISAPIELRLAVQDLYDDYVEAVNDGPLDAWPELFTDPCFYRVVSRENWERGLPLSTMSCETRGMLRDRVAAIRETQVYAPRFMRNLVSSITICKIENGEIQARAHWILAQSMLGELSQVHLTGKYLDTLVQVDGKWKFREKICVFDSNIVPNSVIYPV
jgi:3-phenylpropionate/cinnamic acid dioxygenase small subunit